MFRFTGNKERFLLLDKKLQASFAKIREEFEDHLDSINENTNEMQSIYEYACELDEKIEKLSSRVDEIHMMVRGLIQEKVKQEGRIELTKNEKKIFMTLYTFGEESSLSFADIARRTNLPELEVRRCLTSMLNKGLPLVEELVDEQIYFRINPEFKDLQAKENILDIEVNEVV